MNAIKVDKFSMTVSIEAGARSHEVEVEAMKYGEGQQASISAPADI
jgi:hypothetical protein